MIPYATGFLMGLGGVNHIVTAKHVIMDANGKLQDKNLKFFFNGKNGKIINRSIKDLKRSGANWIFHDNKHVDIAIIPINVHRSIDDVVAIPERATLKSNKLTETEDVIFLSYQPGISLEKVSPIIRRGMISRFNHNNTFYIDGFAFPGNSGSPVLLKARLTDIASSKNNPALLVGVIGAYIPYSEEAISLQTGKTRVIFEDNTGLSIVWPIEKILELTLKKQFKLQVEMLLKQDQSSRTQNNIISNNKSDESKTKPV